MEFLEGRTLKHRIVGAGLALPKGAQQAAPLQVATLLYLVRRIGFPP